MTPLYPALFALLLCAVFSAHAWGVPKLSAWMEKLDRRAAVRLHAIGWSVGQIANKQFRDPAQIARWLAEADRKRPS